MVEVTFKLTETGTVELHLDRPQVLSEVLRICAEKADFEIGDVIAVRNGKVMRLDEYVDVDDAVDVFPAISGG